MPLKDFPRSGVSRHDSRPGERLGIRGSTWKGEQYDPDYGIPRKLGEITCSSPPIVVNGVVVVLAGHEPSYDQTRIENVPADIQGYDAKTGKRLWKFHVIPRPGESGNETWGNDSWKFSGNIASWAPASADPQRGLVYLVTNASTYQFYTGHRPGDNLFGGSILALDVKTGKRKWHFQVHHSEQWNYDIPTAPILMDLTVNGRKVPALIQNTKQGLVFAFNRETGEPIWPIEERPVMQTEVPGNYTSPTQPFPTRPEPLDRIVLNGITDEFIMDYTPELKRRASRDPEQVPRRRTLRAAAAVPAQEHLHQQRRLRRRTEHLPSAGRGSDDRHHVCVAQRSCDAPSISGSDQRQGRRAHGVCRQERGSLARTRSRDADDRHDRRRLEDRVDRPRAGCRSSTGCRSTSRSIQGLAAYDMNTGEKLWDVPVGQTPARSGIIRCCKGVNVPNTGGTGNSIQMVMGDLLVQTTEDLRGEAEVNEKGNPLLHARDKRTGQILASVELPMPGAIRHDDLHARRQAVHRRAVRQREPESAGIARRAHASLRFRRKVPGFDAP